MEAMNKDLESDMLLKKKQLQEALDQKKAVISNMQAIQKQQLN